MVVKYAERLKALRPYVNLNIKARKHFSPAEKGKITRAWNANEKLIKRANRGDVNFRRIAPKDAKRLGLSRRTNKGVFLPKGATASRLVKGNLHIYYKPKGQRPYKSRLVPLKGDLPTQIGQLTKRYPNANFALSINGFKANLDRSGELFAHYDISELIDADAITGISVTDYGNGK